MNRQKLTVNLDERNYEKAIDFFNVYEYEAHFESSNLTSKKFIGSVTDRFCRFCKKTTPETTFKKMAHVFPQFIGNRFLLSAFECDNCNKLFGDLYENSFANYLGILRSFSLFSPSRNNKNPTYKETAVHDNKEKTKLRIEKNGTRSFQIFHEFPFEQSIAFDRENKTGSISATRQPYTPLYVYKMFVKIALSFIGEAELDNYKRTCAFLIDNSQNDKFKKYPLCHVYIHTIYSMPFFATPILYLYRKKNTILNSPSKTAILFAGSQIYQIFIPLNDEDDWLAGQRIKLFPYPLLLDQKYYENGLAYNSFGVLMDSNEKVIGENQKMTFSYEHGEYSDEC